MRAVHEKVPQGKSTNGTIHRAVHEKDTSTNGSFQGVSMSGECDQDPVVRSWTLASLGHAIAEDPRGWSRVLVCKLSQGP